MAEIPDPKNFISFFKSLPEKTSATIRFFNRGEFYTVHGNDALYIAKEFFKSTNGVKILGSENNPLESLVVNRSNFDSFVRDLLLVKQYRVEVYINKGKGSADWMPEYKGSPGNLEQFGNILFNKNDQINSVSVIGIKIGGVGQNKIVGLGYVNVFEKQLCVYEFPDDDRFTNLEGLLVQLGPRECLLPTGETNQEYNHVNQILEKSNVLVTSRKKSEFVSTDFDLDLNKILHFEEGQQQNAMVLPQMNLKVATCALAAVVKYLELVSDSSNENLFSLTTLDMSRYVHLDSAAVRALNIFPPTASTPADQKNCILGLLDKCKTSQGHRLLYQWMKQPLQDINAISDRHDIVEILVQNNDVFENIYDRHLCQVPDFQSLSKKLLKRKATLQDCYRIYQAVYTLPELISTMKNAKSSKLQASFMDPLSDILNDMEGFQSMINSTLDMDEVDKGNFLIKVDFDPQLAECRSAMNQSLGEMEGEVPKVVKDLDLESSKALKLESAPHLGFYFRITLKEEKALRNKKKYEILDTSKNGIRFRNSMLSHWNTNYQDAWSKYNEQQKNVVQDVIEVAASYAESLHSLGCVLAQLDVLTSFAKVAKDCTKGPFIRPIMHEMGSGILSLKRVRHPCLELSVQFVPNNVYFKKDVCTFHIITGPNMGGKSTYIRSVGVVVFLAHLGCFVPCSEAEITVVDAILARVGADDCHLKGMSTFMKEMVETSGVLRRTTCNSLVIIDELGRGTSTYEGCGIAWAIAEYLAKEAKAFCLFATHFHELTQLAEEVSSVENHHVNAIIAKDKLILTYDVKPGESDQSFGIHVAEMAGFPQHVIDYAKMKEAELEEYQGLDFALNQEEKQNIIKEGEKLINEFLTKCQNIDFDSRSETEVIEEVTKYKSQIEAENNSYIQALLQKLV